MKYTVLGVKVGLTSFSMQLSDGHTHVDVALPLLPDPYTNESLMEGIAKEVHRIDEARRKAEVACALIGKTIEVMEFKEPGQ